MAGEPESLDMDEPLGRRVRRHGYDRLLMLSDGVFAIAITLLALELRPPELWPGSLGGLLAVKWRSLLGFAIGFIIVGAVWIAHRTLFARIRRVDGPATLLSLLLLALVSLAPASAAVLAQFGPGRAFPLYLALVSALFATLTALWAYAAFGGRLLHAEVSVTERRAKLIRLLLPALIFATLLFASNRGASFGGGCPCCSSRASWSAVRVATAMWTRRR